MYFGRAFQVVPSVENDGASPFAGTARCRLTGAPKRRIGVDVCESLTANCTAYPFGDGACEVGVSVTTAVDGKASLVQVAVALPSPEPTEPAGGGGGGGGGCTGVPDTTGPST